MPLNYQEYEKNRVPNQDGTNHIEYGRPNLLVVYLNHVSAIFDDCVVCRIVAAPVAHRSEAHERRQDDPDGKQLDEMVGQIFPGQDGRNLAQWPAENGVSEGSHSQAEAGIQEVRNDQIALICHFLV